jgi:hypothetical protein
MYCQMIRVISSPSISTTGLTTLIFAMDKGTLAARNGWEKRRKRAQPVGNPLRWRRGYSTRIAAEKVALVIAGPRQTGDCKPVAKASVTAAS